MTAQFYLDQARTILGHVSEHADKKLKPSLEAANLLLGAAHDALNPQKRLSGPTKQESPTGAEIIGRFVQEHLEVDTASILFSEVWAAYEAYCDKLRVEPSAKPNLIRVMEKAGFKKEQIGSRPYWYVSLK